MDDIRMERLLETIYARIEEELNPEICENCPVVRLIGDLLLTFKEENNHRIMSELGLDAVSVRCPYR